MKKDLFNYELSQLVDATDKRFNILKIITPASKNQGQQFSGFKKLYGIAVVVTRVLHPLSR